MAPSPSLSPSSSPYTLENLPYGVISTNDNPKKRCAIAYEHSAIDIDQLFHQGFFSSITDLKEDNVFSHGNWNTFAALPKDVRKAFRNRVRSAVLDGTVNKANALIPLSNVQCHLPMHIHNFSDFYCSLEHTKNPPAPGQDVPFPFQAGTFLVWCSDVFNLTIQPNWYAMPSVYNGRTSSLVVSGTPFHRPCGMYPDDAPRRSGSGSPQASISVPISFKPESHMDYELEMAVWLSKPVPRGQRLQIAHAQDHIFGLTLLNDWSARQIQRFEMPPLGPFHSKGSCTSVSSWIVPIEALQGAEVAQCSRKTKQEPPPPPHLTWQDDAAAAATFDIDLTVKLLRDGTSYTLCESNLNELHWTPFQQITHLSAAGEGLSPGDVFGTGTISSPRTNADGEKIGLGCLFERNLPIARLKSMPSDLIDTFLKDGDEVIMEGWCKDKAGKVILGFGECRGTVLPAIKD
ncbi:hypothetical protein LTR72_007340 [Exophiala xenobiotica]|nr:hypothetical protein LTR72_007340 [Exophiala xenobiotica]KAK5290989.1 hypothetical protein LTR14_006496 [Exophiala xenobiotica]